MSNHSEDEKIHREELVPFLNKLILYAVKFLAVMMIFVIFASIADVLYVMYDQIILTRPLGVLHMEGILTVLGAFIGVLIAIEIFNNIVIYLKEDSIHVKLVLSTALIAIARKVIILDYKITPYEYIYAIAFMVLATAAAYWIVTRKSI